MRIQMSDSQKAELKEMLSAESMRERGWPEEDWQMMRRRTARAFRLIRKWGIEKRPAGTCAGAVSSLTGAEG